MQSVMIDIVVMLFTIIRSYFPSELRWTAVLTVSHEATQAVMRKAYVCHGIQTPQHSHAESMLPC